MHSLEEVRAEYRRLDKIIGIDTSGIELKISKRAVRNLGSFRAPKIPRTMPLRITLSAFIFGDDAQFIDTIRHEYAHAAVYLLYPGEKHGHDRAWKQMCGRVGCSGERLAPADSIVKDEREKRAKYIVRCDGCGRETPYLRRGRAVELIMSGRGKFLRCTVCGGNRFTLYYRK